MFEGKQAILEEKLDVDHGLLTKLKDYKVITDRQRNDIKVSCIPAYKYVL